MSSSLRPRCLTDVPIEFRKVYLNAHSNPWPYRLFLVPKLPAEDGVPKQPKKRPPIAFFSSRQGSRLEYTNGLWQPPTTKMSEGKIYKWIDQRWQRWPRNMPSEEGDQSGTYIPAGSLASSRDLEVRCEKVILNSKWGCREVPPGERIRCGEEEYFQCHSRIGYGRRIKSANSRSYHSRGSILGRLFQWWRLGRRLAKGWADKGCCRGFCMARRKCAWLDLLGTFLYACTSSAFTS